jgi:hypothetical protein
MAIVNRGFRGRRRQPGAGLIPPGQYLVDDFPVLAAGPTPHVSSADPLALSLPSNERSKP